MAAWAPPSPRGWLAAAATLAAAAAVLLIASSAGTPPHGVGGDGGDGMDMGKGMGMGGLGDAGAEGGDATQWRSGFAAFVYYGMGWTAFAAWSLSFYPQVYENWRKHSVEGLCFDFVAFNFIKHTSYGIFNVVLYYSKSVQREYMEYYNTKTIPVALNDVGFSIHAVALVMVQLGQLCTHERGHKQGISFTATMIMLCAVLFILVNLCLALSGTSFLGLASGWLGFISNMNNLQLMMTFIKYAPQAYHNYKRKSTEGWSVHGVILDLVGGICNLLQLLTLCWNNHDFTPLEGNAGKLGLSAETLLFDFFFIFQHVVLYSDRSRIQYAQLHES